MKKKLFERGFLGIFIGLATERFLTIFISLKSGNGDYMAVKPEFAEAMGSELYAVILQTVLFITYGIVLGMAGVVLGNEKWSIAKQTAIYVAIFGNAWFPVALVCRLIPRSLFGIFVFLCSLVVVYILIWAMLHITWKIEIRKMNKCIQKNNEVK